MNEKTLRRSKRFGRPQTFAGARAPLVLCLALLAAAVLAAAQARAPHKVRYLSYEEAKPILEAASADPEILPPPLRGKTPAEMARDWPAWVARRDAEIRARLAQGDADTVVNFLLFGTSYTKRPRVTQKQVQQLGQQQGGADPAVAGVAENLRARADDLVRASAAPGNNDRLLFVRRLLAEQKGFRLDTAAGREQARDYLLASVAQVLGEFNNYAKILAAARAQGATEEFMGRSSIFRTRGLSSDTTLLPNFAIEEALKAVQARGLLAAGGVRRVAIIGPGLDIADKQEGYDFYPLQSIQPFAVIDTLLRLGLARPGELQVTTLDLSPRVNDHLRQARLRAERGRGYVIHLPRDTEAGWTAGAVSYWERFGDRVGRAVPPLAPPPNAGTLKARAVEVRPAVVASVTPADSNVVLQRPELPAPERYDLIVATNILVYYDLFEQSLAVANIERMLRPGGLLLSNNAVVELPFSRLRNVDYTTVAYSDRAGDGDHVVWYRRAED